jgi:hypothetical protein
MSHLTLAGTDIPAVEGMHGGQRTAAGTPSFSTSPLFAKHGEGFEINAGSKKDLLQQIGFMLDQYGGKLANSRPTGREAAAEVARRNQVVAEAFYDKSGDEFQLLGEVVTDQIVETAERQGFARTILGVRPLGKGEDAKIPVRKRDVVAFMATVDSKITTQEIRQGYLYPPLFSVDAYIVIEEGDIQGAPFDLLDAKFQDGLIAMMVREDRILRDLLLAAAPLFNDRVFFGNFNPASLAQMQNQVSSWGTPASNLLIAYDLWQDIIANNDFVNWFDPVHQHELILEGRLGTLLGMQVLTDGLRYDQLRVLEQGEAFVTAAPGYLGVILEQTPPEAKAIDLAVIGQPARGWFIHSGEGMIVGNARAVCFGQRV